MSVGGAVARNARAGEEGLDGREQRFEAHRGAVREALKQLEQLGVAEIHPGGARVAAPRRPEGGGG